MTPHPPHRDTSRPPLALDISGLRKSFHGRPSVTDVGFTVARGRIVGLLGPNGAGKTTTIRLILGLAQPDAGSALVFGERYRDLTRHLPRGVRRVGAVLDAGGLDPARSGRDHLRIAALRGGVRRSRVDDVLAEVVMTADADRRASSYSLGMRQRIAIASALLAEPDILILDEPANGLDPAGMLWLRQYLRAFADAGGTMLLSSHLLGDVQHVADDIVVMAGGRVVAAATLADTLAASGCDLEGFYLRATASPPDNRARPDQPDQPNDTDSTLTTGHRS